MIKRVYFAWCPSDGAREFFTNDSIRQNRTAALEELTSEAIAVIKRYVGTEFRTNFSSDYFDNPIQAEEMISKSEVGYEVVGVRHGYIRFYRTVEKLI